MHHQKMVVLGLISIGKKYGFQIEEFIDQIELRRWADIGSSTIYKVLKDLERAGDIAGRKVPSGKGPARTEFHLTKRGKERLTGYILASLQSSATAHFDRIAGLFFLPLLPRGERADAIADVLADLDRNARRLDQHLEANHGDAIGDVIIEFYHAVNRAQIAAFEKIGDRINGA